VEPLRLLIFSGSRADYGLIRWVYLEANRTHNVQANLLRLINENEFQLIGPFVEADESPIQVTPIGKCREPSTSSEEKELLLSYSAVMSQTYDSLNDLKCDGLVVLGDRLEMNAAVIAASIMRKPIVHLCGGDVGEGTIDNSIRAAVTQMSSLHLVTSEDARARVLGLGVSSSRVVNTGSLAIDGWLHRNRKSKSDIVKLLGFATEVDYGLVTIHPCPLDVTPFHQIAEAVEALLAEFTSRDLKTVVTLPNQDLGSREISDFLANVAARFPDDVRLFEKVGHDNYLSLLEHAELCAGNSSSGLYEAPLARTPTLDIGIRQRGRLRGDSVVSSGWSPAEIKRGIALALGSRFEFTYPYGHGASSGRIVKEIVRFFSER